MWCVVKLGTLSLLLSLLTFLLPFLFLSYLSFSLFFFFFFFSCSFSYSCSCSCSFSFSSFFFLPFYSLFSSLPFTPTNTVQSTDQQTRRPTLRRLNVHGTFRATANELHGMFPPLLFPPLLSSLLPPSHTQKKKRGLFITGIFPARELSLYYSFLLIQKNQRWVELQSLQFYINSKTNLHHVKSVIIFAKMLSSPIEQVYVGCGTPQLTVLRYNIA